MSFLPIDAHTVQSIDGRIDLYIPNIKSECDTGRQKSSDLSKHIEHL
jgi:hypothetical protein